MTLQSSSKTSWKLSDPISSWNVRGPGRKQNIPKVTAGKTKPQLISSLLLYPGPPFLPRREWARGAWLHVLTVQRTGERSMFINITSYTEESLCSPVLQGPFPPESVLHRLSRMGEAPDAAHISGPVTPCGCSKALAPRETLNISHCSAPALLQRCSNVGRKTRLSFTRKAKS